MLTDAAEFSPLHWSDTISSLQRYDLLTGVIRTPHSSEEVDVAWFFFCWSCFRCCAMRFFYLIEPPFNPPSKSIDYENTKNCGKACFRIIAVHVNNNFLNGDKFYLFFLKERGLYNNKKLYFCHES